MSPLTRGLVGVVVAWLGLPASAAGPDDAKGWWLTAARDAVIEFKACAEDGTALCGHIVWDRDAGTAHDTCGTQIARYARYADQAWRDGWAFDPRDERKYRSVVRVQGDDMRLRAFVGTELLGQTERRTRLGTLPAHPRCARPGT